MVQNVYPINTNSIRALSVGVDGDISLNHNNMESNLNNSVYIAYDLIFQTSVNVPKGYLIDYQNIDGGDSLNLHLVTMIESNILYYQFMTKMETR